jgi:ABC-type molybdate transport system substrate-binding protein
VCSGAMRAVLQQLTPAFEKSSGDKLVIEYASAGKVEQKVAADEAIDVAILTKPRADRLVRDAKLVGGTTTVLARVPIGLAVKSGAPHPDISSVEAVKRTLLDAKSIAYVDPASGGTSGIFLAQALEKLGIAAELKSKVRLVSPTAAQSSPPVGEIVQLGKAEATPDYHSVRILSLHPRYPRGPRRTTANGGGTQTIETGHHPKVLARLPPLRNRKFADSLRWREMDSNFRYRSRKAPDFQNIPEAAGTAGVRYG